jgi:hypothetical protein
MPRGASYRCSHDAAIYKNLFDARRKLRAKLADAGYPLLDENRVR